MRCKITNTDAENCFTSIYSQISHPRLFVTTVIFLVTVCIINFTKGQIDKTKLLRKKTNNIEIVDLETSTSYLKIGETKLMVNVTANDKEDQSSFASHGYH